MAHGAAPKLSHCWPTTSRMTSSTRAAERLGNLAHLRRGIPPHEDIGQTRIGRITQELAFRQLIKKKTLTVVGGCGLNRAAFRQVGLHKHAPFEITPTGTPGNLLDKSERPLCAAEIG